MKQFITFILLTSTITYISSESQIPDDIFDSPSAFLTSAIKTIFGPNHSVVFASPNAKCIFASKPEEVLTGDLHGEFNFFIDRPGPDIYKVSTLVRITNYAIYNEDGQFKKIYSPGDPNKMGYGSITSAKSWQVRPKFRKLAPEMKKDSLELSPAELYKKYLSIFLPLNVDLHTNILLPSIPGVHGQIYNKEELFVKSDEDIYNFPFSNARFVASGAVLIDDASGEVDLSILPGWKGVMSVVKSPAASNILTREIIEQHIHENIIKT